MSSTTSQLASQWANPRDVTTVLMIIGGDVVQKALAQTTGCWYTPVCFSFGWVAYSFIALVSVIGDGRLLPPPDYPVKVFNLRTGYVRDNKNWVIGRLLRDHEAQISRREPAPHSGIRIEVLEARNNMPRQSRVSFAYSRIHIWGIVTTAIQLMIAAIPIINDRRWGILLITGSGTLMALIAGSLPQWRAEKLPNRQRSEKAFALTTGNGSKDIMIIIGDGQCLDLEDLSAQETPRGQRPWDKFRVDVPSRPIRNTSLEPGAIEDSTANRRRSLHLSGMNYHELLTRTVHGIPGGFLVTIVVCVAQSILWLLFLITVAALSTDTWYLILIGGIGMFQNGYVAAMERTPEHRNCPLVSKDVITTFKVMDGLMDLETVHGRPRLTSENESEPFMMSLVKEYFPGKLSSDEEDWWKGKPDKYDESRSKQNVLRGFPRRALSRKSTADSSSEMKDPQMVSRKTGNDHDASKGDIPSGRSQLPNSNQEPIERPNSSPQVLYSALDPVSEQPAEETPIAVTRVHMDSTKSALFRPGSPTSQSQRHSMPQLGRIIQHNEQGTIVKPPPWS